MNGGRGGRHFLLSGRGGVDRLFLGFDRTAFRLETLQVYSAPEEAAELQAFLAGDGRPGGVSDMMRGWLAEVAAGVAQGKRYQRVHVVTEPLSDYMRFECACAYEFSTVAGEEAHPPGTGGELARGPTHA